MGAGWVFFRHVRVFLFGMHWSARYNSLGSLNKGQQAVSAATPSAVLLFVEVSNMSPPISCLVTTVASLHRTCTISWANLSIRHALTLQ
jgi:hypothetical protein